MVYAYIIFTLIGALIFCSGMLAGIRCYKHAQMPFMDLTPVKDSVEENTTVSNTESLDWNVAEQYINNLSDKDSDEE